MNTSFEHSGTNNPCQQEIQQTQKQQITATQSMIYSPFMPNMVKQYYGQGFISPRRTSSFRNQSKRFISSNFPNRRVLQNERSSNPSDSKVMKFENQNLVDEEEQIIQEWMVNDNITQTKIKAKQSESIYQQGCNFSFLSQLQSSTQQYFERQQVGMEKKDEWVQNEAKNSSKLNKCISKKMKVHKKNKSGIKHKLREQKINEIKELKENNSIEIEDEIDSMEAEPECLDTPIKSRCEMRKKIEKNDQKLSKDLPKSSEKSTEKEKELMIRKGKLIQKMKNERKKILESQKVAKDEGQEETKAHIKDDLSKRIKRDQNSNDRLGQIASNLNGQPESFDIQQQSQLQTQKQNDKSQYGLDETAKVKERQALAVQSDQTTTKSQEIIKNIPPPFFISHNIRNNKTTKAMRQHNELRNQFHKLLQESEYMGRIHQILGERVQQLTSQIRNQYLENTLLTKPQLKKQSKEDKYFSDIADFFGIRYLDGSAIFSDFQNQQTNNYGNLEDFSGFFLLNQRNK